MSEWPTKPVELDHLETMGILMSLYSEEQSDGLSEPQISAKDKLETLLSQHMRDLRPAGR